MLPIWIDCDPGIDDAIMLALAAASQDRLHICGISAVAGNRPLNYTAPNALHLTSMLRLNVPVAYGAAGPLIRDRIDAGYVHGENGLGNCQLPATDKQPEADNAVLCMRRAILSLPEGEQMTLVPTGPLTNIALLLHTFPEVKPHIRQIVLMGGSAGHGNSTPYAEFNVYADPDAAQMVYASGLPIVMCGLDVTEKSLLTKAQINEIAAMPHPIHQHLSTMLRFYGDTVAYASMTGICVHDAGTILYLIHPELFSGWQASVEVVRTGERMGQTVCTPGGNVLVLDQVDLPRYQQCLLAGLRTL